MDVDIYTDKDFYKYNVAIHKAINKEESPVKQKHVRSTIIGTFSQQGAKVFWTIALRLPSMDDIIVAWKFCHVLHKILREGHPLCIDHSQKHKRFLVDLGRLWGHLEEGYGKLIKQYTNLLITKLEFHRRNPRFPGNLSVTTEDLSSICSNNPDICFQLSVEMFDFLDAILELQQTIFLSKASSMTMQGQCRLAPIIPCIQDASRLYDHNVKILFMLHSSVPYDVLEGHRERFLKQFKQLKLFYQNTNMMHYFKNLITVAPLPDSPPNFQANFNTYVTQEVFVAQDEEEMAEANLIDTSEPPVQVHEEVQPPVRTVDFDIIAERDNIIRSLHRDCDRLKSEINVLYDKNIQQKKQLQEQINSLETKVAVTESELLHEKLENEKLAISQPIPDDEQKAKEEKFKTSYLKLREEHIQLLREKARVEKNLKSVSLQVNEQEQYKQQFEIRFKDAESKNERVEVEYKQLEVRKNEEIQMLSTEKAHYEHELKKLQTQVSDINTNKISIEENLSCTLKKSDELAKTVEELMLNITKKDGELDKLKLSSAAHIDDIINSALSESEGTIKGAIEEMDNPALSAVTCTPDYLCNITGACQDSLKLASDLSRDDPLKIITVASRIAHKHAVYILHGKATSNSSPDITFGEKMADSCKTLGESILTLFKNLKENKSTEDVVDHSLNHLSNVVTLAETMIGSVKGETVENLESLLNNEMVAMDKAIEAAAIKMQDMLSKSREADSGIKLQVNEKILDSCTKLMEAIRHLVQKSKLLQAEIVSQGKGTASTKEFYKRNHRWTDGFISAAKAVAVGATFLLSAADKVVDGQGKLETLVVAAQEISASTAQLVVASRVKADKNSTNLKQLSVASKEVTNATGAIVGTVKDCSELIDNSTEIDITNMSLHQAKRSEMDAQVRVLELEKELQQERMRLSALRRYHYQLAGEENFVLL